MESIEPCYQSLFVCLFVFKKYQNSNCHVESLDGILLTNSAFEDTVGQIYYMSWVNWVKGSTNLKHLDYVIKHYFTAFVNLEE